MTGIKNNRPYLALVATVLLLILLAPLIQHLAKPIALKSLNGYHQTSAEPMFSLSGWFLGDYQQNAEKYLEENAGFRSLEVRLYNQLQFSLYREVNTQGVVIGKDGYLYSQDYIDAFLGNDFVGEEKIKERVWALGKIQDTLKKLNKNLLVVLAPGKASYLPEYLPKQVHFEDAGITNYEIYSQALNTSSVPFLNLFEWFKQAKDSSRFPLYPKTGIHWSRYAELMAANKILKIIDSIQPKPVPYLRFTTIDQSLEMNFTDDDIEKSLNLLFDIDDLTMAYPNYNIEDTDDQNNPKVLAVADSYFWGMHASDFNNKLFGKSEFWYYHTEVDPMPGVESKKVADLDLIEAVENNDVVMLMATDANLYKFAYGFIDELYSAYYHDTLRFSPAAQKASRIKELTDFILEGTKADYNELVEKGMIKEGISRQTSAQNLADFLYWQETQDKAQHYNFHKKRKP